MSVSSLTLFEVAHLVSGGAATDNSPGRQPGIQATRISQAPQGAELNMMQQAVPPLRGLDGLCTAIPRADGEIASNDVSRCHSERSEESRDREPQRGSTSKPRVAKRTLGWKYKRHMNPERVLHECATLSGLWWVWNSEPRVALRREGDFADPGLRCFDAFSVKIAMTPAAKRRQIIAPGVCERHALFSVTTKTGAIMMTNSFCRLMQFLLKPKAKCCRHSVAGNVQLQNLRFRLVSAMFSARLKQQPLHTPRTRIGIA